MQSLNENILKFTGSLSIPDKLPLDHDMTFGINANIQKIEKRSNNDNTFNFVYTAKLTGESVIQKDHGKNITVKAKGSPSQRFRSKLRIDFDGDDFDVFYETYLNKLIVNSQEVWEFLKTL